MIRSNVVVNLFSSSSSVASRVATTLDQIPPPRAATSSKDAPPSRSAYSSWRSPPQGRPAGRRGVLVGAPPPKRGMVGALHEPRQHATAASVDRGDVVVVLGEHVVGGADRHDDTAADRDRAVGDDAEIALRMP